MAWGNNNNGWHPSHVSGGSSGVDQQRAYWDAYYARKRAEEQAQRQAPWTATMAQQSTQPGYFRRAITGQPVETPDYAQSYMPMVPNVSALSATAPVLDPNTPGPPEPNLAPETPVGPTQETPVGPTPATAPRYQSLGMDSALANYSGLPVKPRRGGIYTLILGAR